MKNIFENNQVRDLLKNHFETDGFVRHQIDTFDDYIYNSIQRIVTEEPDIHVCPKKDQSYTVKFGKVWISPPAILEEDRTLRPIYPAEARTRDQSYDAAIHVDIEEIWEEEGEKEVKTFRRAIIGRTPIMIRSGLCNLLKLTPAERITAGECEHDQGGYFVIKGKERVLLGQIRGVYNKVLVIPQKANDKYQYIAEIRSMSEETGHSAVVQAMIDVDDNHLCFSLPYIKEVIPVGVVFKALGFIDEEEILNFVGLNLANHIKYRKMIIRDAFFVSNTDDALKHISQYPMHVIKEDKRIDYGKQVVEKELFPHMGVMSTNREKAYFLGYMINKLISTKLGLRQDDDRDNYANKRVEMAGVLCSDLFRTLFKRYLSNIVQQIEKKKQRPDIMTMISRINSITVGLKQCFSTGNWGVQKNAYMRTGVSQILSRMTYGATLSHLRRIVIPIGKEGKNTKIRQIHPSQIFFCCPAETPEGQSAGIVLNLALTCRITTRVPTVLIKEIIEKSENIINLDDFRGNNVETRVFLNGVFLAVTEEPDSLVEELKEYRQSGLISKQVSVTYDSADDEIKIYCDEGRLIRPLFKYSDQDIDTSKTWHELTDSNVIEYLDNTEIEETVIAMTPKDIDKYDCEYCEINPSMMMGVMANIIPFSNHTQSPRVCYQSSMGKQAIGIYSLSHLTRSDTITHVLDYPQKPLVSTMASDFMGFSDVPSGINAIVAIACYSGFNQEDSVLLNRNAVERGLFWLTSYRTLVEEEKKCSAPSTFEIIQIPPLDCRRKDCNYGLLDDDGVVKVGVPVKKGDVIIGKVLKVSRKGEKDAYTDSSLVIKSGEEGSIDRIIATNTPNGYKLVKVVVRCSKIPEVGDKFACYSPDTDVLTENGWKNITKITKNDKIASLQNRKRLEYIHPTDLQSYDYDGNMYTVDHEHVDLCVTPNHRMFTWVPSISCTGNFTIQPASEIKGEKRCYMSYVSEWEPNNNMKQCVIPSAGGFPSLVVNLETWCTFFGIWISNGSVLVGNDNNKHIKTNSVHIRLDCNNLDIDDSQGLKNCLEECMNKMGLGWNLRVSTDGKIDWWCDDPRLYEYLKNFNISDNKKYLPRWCFNMDIYHSRVLARYIMISDKSYDPCITDLFTTFQTTSTSLRDDFQRLCMHTGWPCTYEEDRNENVMCLERGTPLKVWKIKTRLLSMDTVVNEEDKDEKDDYWAPYKGKVYCCTVPTEDGVILVRRNGKPVWCGNSRSAQKGTCGMTYPQEDMPFSPTTGLTPDIVINSHCIPSRMTINQLMECILGKTCALEGEFGDATPWKEESSEKLANKLCENLAKTGFERHGTEELYNGMTGEPLEAKIFIGPTYYQRLKHMVSDKIHSRSSGHVTTLTRQPLEGRSRDGGLRFGEMERDCMITHGVSKFLKERLFEQSDPYQIVVCNKCGNISTTQTECRGCHTDNVSLCNMPYAAKLLTQELNAMSIKTAIKVKQ